MGWVKNPRTQPKLWVGLKKNPNPSFSVGWVEKNNPIHELNYKKKPNPSLGVGWVKKTQPKSWRGLGWVIFGLFLYIYTKFMQNLCKINITIIKKINICDLGITPAKIL